MESLNEAIAFARKALDLRPVGHNDRPSSCVMLATLLRHLLGGRQINQAIYDEVLPLLQEAINLFAEEDPARWWCLKELAALAVVCRDWPSAIKYLYVSMRSPTHSLNAVISSTAALISQIDVDTISDDDKQKLLLLYREAMDLVALGIGFAVETSTQLEHIRTGSMLGLQAFILTRGLKEHASGLQLLERARGVTWSQALHMRDPQLEGVPVELAQRLQGLISDLTRAPPIVLQAEGSFATRSLGIPSRDVRFVQRRQAQETIREIRALPGHNNFMLGPDISALFDVSARSFVVVLAATDQECHAVIMTPANGPIADLTHRKINRKILQELTFAGLTSQRRGSSTVSDEDEQRGMRISKGASPAHSCLAKLWHGVVRPIIRCLGLKVSSKAGWKEAITLTSS
jgi:hypothetical protein